MDRERDRDAAEGLIDDAKKQIGADDTAKRPEQGTDKPGGDEGGALPEEDLEKVEEQPS